MTNNNILRMPVAELEGHGLSLRIINQLEERFGVMYLGDLQAVTEQDILEERQMGAGTLREIRASLSGFLESCCNGDS